MKTDDTEEVLGGTVDDAEWEALRPHAERGALILVSPELDLADVGAKFADDETEAVQGWLEAGKIARPTEEQLKEWDQRPSRPFRFLIVRPYVLAQEHILH